MGWSQYDIDRGLAAMTCQAFSVEEIAKQKGVTMRHRCHRGRGKSYGRWKLEGHNYDQGGDDSLYSMDRTVVAATDE